MPIVREKGNNRSGSRGGKKITGKKYLGNSGVSVVEHGGKEQAQKSFQTES